MEKRVTIIRHINNTNPKRVIILSPRQSYAKSICNEYNERVTVGEKFTCYLDVKAKKSIPFIDSSCYFNGKFALSFNFISRAN